MQSSLFLGKVRLPMRSSFSLFIISSNKNRQNRRSEGAEMQPDLVFVLSSSFISTQVFLE